MFDNLNLRNKFLAAAAVPANIGVLVALWAAVVGQYGVALLALAGAAGAVAAAVEMARSVSDRMAALAAQADELATVRLPGLLATVHLPGPAVDGHQQSGSPRPTGEAYTGADAPTGSSSIVHPDDELGRVAMALEAIETRTRIALDEERAAISRHLGAMVKNLARRNQSLLDRQIEHIDWLEAKEQDPDRLEQLFKLDHLATRMRRSSESVLVLGGSEAARHRGGPAPIAEILRVAMGETEDYRNIRLRTVDEVLVVGGPAFDLAHLLAEVLENATQFSPPESPVELHATRLDTGNYQITVIDRGVGMDQRQLDSANALVADPPEISLSVGHAVGFIVVGRLARRIGAQVELTGTAGSGVTVQIKVPASHIIEVEPSAVVDDGTPSDDPAPSGGMAEGPLQRLMGLEGAELPEGGGWVPPAVGGGRSKPLRARDGATAAVPPGLRPTGEAPTSAAPAPAVRDAEAPATKRPRPRATAPNVPAATTQPTAPGRTGAHSAPVEPSAGQQPSSPPASAALPPRRQGPEVVPAYEETPADETHRHQADDVEPRSERAEATPDRSDAPTPALTPTPRPTGGSGRKAKTLAEAIPTGSAFDSGVDGLLAAADESTPTDSTPAPTDGGPSGSMPAPSESPLPASKPADDSTWTPPIVGPAAGSDGGSLTKRERGKAAPPVTNGVGARASARKPEEIRSMLTRYRSGIKGNGVDSEGAMPPMTEVPHLGDRTSVDGSKNSQLVTELVNEAVLMNDATPTEPAAATESNGKSRGPAGKAGRSSRTAGKPGADKPGGNTTGGNTTGGDNAGSNNRADRRPNPEDN